MMSLTMWVQMMSYASLCFTAWFWPPLLSTLPNYSISFLSFSMQTCYSSLYDLCCTIFFILRL